MNIYDGRVKEAQSVYDKLKARGVAYKGIMSGIRQRMSKAGNQYLERVSILVDSAGNPTHMLRESKGGKLYVADVPGDLRMSEEDSPWKDGQRVQTVEDEDLESDVPYAAPPKYGPEVMGPAEWNKQMKAYQRWLDSEKSPKQGGDGKTEPAKDNKKPKESKKGEPIEGKTDIQAMIDAMNAADMKAMQEMAAGQWDVYAKPRQAQGTFEKVARQSADSAKEAENLTRPSLQPSQWVISEVKAVPAGSPAPDPNGGGGMQMPQAQQDDDPILLLRKAGEPLEGPDANERILQTVATPMMGMLKQVVTNIKKENDANLNALHTMLAELEGAVNEPAVQKIVQDALKAAGVTQTTEIVIKQDGKEPVTLQEHAHPIFGEVLKLAAARQPTYLYGPSGSGKTTLAEQVAKALELDFFAISSTMGMSESQLQGWRLPLSGSKFVYVPSEFVKLYEGGGVFLLDEADRSDPNVLAVLNQALANRRMPVPARFEKPVADMHPDFVMMAAGNTAGTGSDRLYTAATRLDEAFLDRFRAGTLFMDYDQDLELKLVGSETELLRALWQIRAKVAELRLERVVSTRYIIEAHKLGLSVQEGKERLTCTWEPNERQKVGV